MLADSGVVWGDPVLADSGVVWGDPVLADSGAGVVRGEGGDLAVLSSSPHSAKTSTIEAPGFIYV